MIPAADLEQIVLSQLYVEHGNAWFTPSRKAAAGLERVWQLGSYKGTGFNLETKVEKFELRFRIEKVQPNS